MQSSPVAAATGLPGRLVAQQHPGPRATPASVEPVWTWRHALRAERPLLVALAATMLVAAVTYLQLARGLWFYADDWVFLVDRTPPAGLIRSLLAPHNEHLSLLPVAVFRLTFAVVGLKSYVAYAAWGIAAHVATSAVLYGILRKARFEPLISFGCAVILLFVGGGGENTLWDFQIGFLGSALFGMLTLSFTIDYASGARPVWHAWVSAVMALAASGMGLPLLVVSGLYLLWRGGLRRAITLASVPAVLYGTWFLATRGMVTRPTGPLETTLGSVLDFFWVGMRNVWDVELGGIVGAGSLFLGITLTALALTAPTFDKAVVVSCFVGALAVYLATAISRASWGTTQATASRYVYFGVLLTLPLLATILTVLAAALPARIRWARMASTVAVCTALLVVGAFTLKDFVANRHTWIDGTRERVLAAHELVSSGAEILTDQVERRSNPDLETDFLADPEVAATLPDGTPSAEDLLEARGALQVAIPGAGFGYSPTPAAAIVLPHGPTPPACFDVMTAPGSVHVEVTPAGVHTRLRFTSTVGSIETFLIDSAGRRSPIEWWEVDPGVPTSVALAAEGVTLALSTGAFGTLTICPA